MEVFHNCYYINLDRSKDRRETMEKRFANLKRVEGVDGKELNISNEVLKKCGMNVFQIGCLQSHLKAIKTAYDNGDEEALIMEDDIYADYFNKWENSIEDIVKNKPEDAECIILHCSNKNKMKKMLVMDCNYSPWIKGRWSTGSYYITRKGMEKIITYGLNYIPNGCKPADIFIYETLITYNYTKPIFNLKNIYGSLIDKINIRNDSDKRIFDKYFNKIKLIKQLKHNSRIRKKNIILDIGKLKNIKQIRVKRRIIGRLRNNILSVKKNNKILKRIIN